MGKNGKFLLLCTLCALLGTLVATAQATSGGITAYRKSSYGSRLMKVGTRGSDVATLQKYLTRLGKPTARDGAYGLETKGNVKAIERSRHWKIDGRVQRKQAIRIRKIARATPPPTAGSTGRRFYFFGSRTPAVTLSAGRAGTAYVSVIDETGAQVMKLTVELTASDGGASGSIAWYGRDASGAVADDGVYGFAIAEGGDVNAMISGGQTGQFSFYAAIFPVRGDHDFGGADARFGAPRGDHIHQGQDVSAPCGTPLVAAQGGTVVTRSFQASGAGNYMVIEGRGSGKDYVFMHMIAPGNYATGATVKTGAVIGAVGNTGESYGCHLHFERWTAPGWYQGGVPTDPLPSLQYWDSYS